MGLDYTHLGAAVRIIGDVPAPDLVTGRRRATVGTGFLVTVQSETLPGLRYGYVLTAHHVIDDAGTIEVQPGHHLFGPESFPPREITDWRQARIAPFRPDGPEVNLDLALAPFPDEGEPKLAISLEDGFLDERVMGPKLGGGVYYIGILHHLNDRPMARSGTIGSIYQDNIRHEGGYDFPAHLIDCRSYAGFGGSPCFVELSFASLVASPWPQMLTPEPIPPHGVISTAVRFFGMFTGHIAAARDEAVGRFGVGILLPGEFIREALMSEELMEERRRWDAAGGRPG
jgi:hypothetical protein